MIPPGIKPLSRKTGFQAFLQAGVSQLHLQLLQHFPVIDAAGFGQIGTQSGRQLVLACMGINHWGAGQSRKIRYLVEVVRHIARLPIAHIINFPASATRHGRQTNLHQIIGMNAIGPGSKLLRHHGLTTTQPLQRQFARAIDASNPQDHQLSTGTPGPAA